MHVIELHAENYKRLVAVDVTPTSHVVEIVGRNAQGKTSLLESMLVALGGAEHIPSKPIRKGEKKAGIRLKLGSDKPELIVTRTFAAKEDGGYTTQLVLEAADGSRYAKPQTLLDELLGALAFDPLAFTRMKPREQLEQLRAFVPDVNFAAIDGQNLRDFESRTEINREIKGLNARLAAMTIPGDPRQQRVDETALVAELEAAGERKAELERECSRRTGLEEQITRHKADVADTMRRRQRVLEQIQELQEQAETLLDRAAKATAHEEQLVAELAALPAIADPPNTAELRARIDAARRTNLEVDTRARVIREREQIALSLKSCGEKADALTAAIEGRNTAKASAVAAAKMPVDGLGFGDDAVLFNGLPFDQASSAEQLRVSVAIAAAMNSKLKVIHVRDGSLIDEDGMTMLRQFAADHGMQIWVERVASDSPIGIVIEDGRVKAPVAAEASA